MQAVLSALTYLLLAILLPQPASANDWTGCMAGAPSVQIAACGRIIEKGAANPASLATAYRFRASAYARAKDQVKAVEDLNQAIKADPPHAAYYRGLIYFGDDNPDRAIAEFDDAIKSDPGNSAIYNSRGAAYNAKGDRDRAIADYSEAIRLEPGFFGALTNRSFLHRLKGDFDLAIADASKAIELKPDHTQAYIARALAFGRKGELDGGIADCAKAIELDPNYADAYDCASIMHYNKHDYDKAIEEGTKAIGLNPQLAGPYIDRGVSYAAKRDLDRALADYGKAIELNPRYALAFNNRANVYLSRKEADRALADFDKAIELDPKFALAYYNRGRIYQRRNSPDKALADYRKVLELPALTVTEKQRQELVRQRIARLTQAQRGTKAPEAAASQDAQPVPAPAGQARRFERIALVIGNSTYAHAAQLPNPKNDAAAVAASLRRIGFGEVMEVYDLDRAAMSQAFKRFGDMAENADWAVVFFAGHGLEMNGVSYLIPTDAELLRDTHVSDEAISLTQVQAKVDAASKLGLVILDSCRNNPFLEHMSRSFGGTRAIGQGLANVEPEGNVLVAYSAKHGTTALDGEGAHSPFTEALLKHIEEPGLEINFLFRKVRDDVRNKTQRQQEPFLYGSLSAELLYFKAVPAQ
jgi:tetratricopeptide (TPR) repeat protein